MPAARQDAVEQQSHPGYGEMGHPSNPTDTGRGMSNLEPRGDISTFNSPSIRAHIIVVLYPLGEIDCMEILEDFGTNRRGDTKSGASPYRVVDFRR